MNNPDEIHTLEKHVWSDADHEQLSFHDSHVFAFSLITHADEVVLDIDYIFEWVLQPDKKHWKFWVAPATLVFEDARDVELNWDGGSDLFELDRIAKSDEEVYPATGYTTWLWSLEGNVGGSVSLRASGYKLYVRQNPRLIEQQHLGLEERGGTSFSREFHEDK